MNEQEQLALAQQRIAALNALTELAENRNTPARERAIAGAAYDSICTALEESGVPHCNCGLAVMHVQLQADCREHSH